MESTVKKMPACVMQKVALAPYTTLGVGGFAEYLADVSSDEMLKEVIAWANQEKHKITILAGGSNVLVANGGISGIVVRPQFTEITYTQSEDRVTAVVGAGVELDVFVSDTVSKNFWGMENLSGIPGSVGATPVQNVGAYGVEVKDVIYSVRVFDMRTEKFFELKNDLCAFSYRDSIFKKIEGKNFLITHVTFVLDKNKNCKINYKDLAHYFADTNEPTIAQIRNAVLEIRSKKFPDWRVVGTAGSFFKNPIVSSSIFNGIKLQYPDIPGYITESGDVKIALGWILEHVCGLKGYAEGSVGLFEKQALVLVCVKGISAQEVENFSEKIILLVKEKINISVEREVTILK